MALDARPDLEGGLPHEIALPKLAGPPEKGHTLGARLRNYFLTGIIVAGPVAVTAYIVWWIITTVDGWVEPLVPQAYLPDNYLPFRVPGYGLVVAIIGLTLLGFLTANLVGRSFLRLGEVVLGRMPLVRGVYRTFKQIFETIFSQSSGLTPVRAAMPATISACRVLFPRNSLANAPGVIDNEVLLPFAETLRETESLDIAELWAFAPMLKFGIVERLCANLDSERLVAGCSVAGLVELKDGDGAEARRKIAVVG